MSERKPEWLKVSISSGEKSSQLAKVLHDLKLHTVCQSAICPNRGDCWQKGTATFMLLGSTCTRGCRFCAVTTGNPQGLLDEEEPQKIARAVALLDLEYVVLTMVTRDDLADGGACHVSRTIQQIRHHNQSVRVEALVSDFGNRTESINEIVQRGQPDVFGHNVEVVPGLQQKMRDKRCNWDCSINTLIRAKEAGVKVTKSSLMIGCGENDEEVLDAMRKLRTAKVDILTIGQYLRPSAKHAQVIQYHHPNEFDWFREVGLKMGFKYVASGPMVRSSYRAAEAYADVMPQEQNLSVGNAITAT